MSNPPITFSIAEDAPPAEPLLPALVRVLIELNKQDLERADSKVGSQSNE